MEWIPVVVIVGIAVLFFGGKKFAPKIIGQGKEGANAWMNEAKSAFNDAKKEEDVDGEKQQ